MQLIGTVRRNESIPALVFFTLLIGGTIPILCYIFRNGWPNTVHGWCATIGLVGLDVAIVIVLSIRFSQDRRV